MNIAFERHIPQENPPTAEERDAVLLIIDAQLTLFSAGAWRRYQEIGRGLYVISPESLREQLEQYEGESFWKILDFPYHTEEWLQRAGVGGPYLEQIRFFLESYNPEVEVVFHVVRLQGKHSFYVVHPDHPPPMAERFAGQMN